LDEHTGAWFDDLESNGNASPYMSLTAYLTKEAQRKGTLIHHHRHNAY